MADDLMLMRFGRGTVLKNLERAVADGKLAMNPDGSFTPKGTAKSPVYLQVGNVRKMQCDFLSTLLFHIAYDKSAVPFGCHNCYKVKIAPFDFRGLIALRDILEKTPYQSKCGVDFYNPHSRDVYAGFLYLEGLEAARQAYHQLREVVDQNAELGNSVRMTIKRGCSEMEAACGPSDQWQFQDGLPEIEAALQARYKPDQTAPVPYRLRRMASMVQWMQTAYSIGDDTYLAYTGGKPLHKPTVSYPVSDMLRVDDRLPETCGTGIEVIAGLACDEEALFTKESR